MARLTPILALVAIICVASMVDAKKKAGKADAKATECVTTLNEENFDAKIADPQYELVIVEFYAPWCGHCKRLAPEYEAACKELKGKNVLLAKVDATIDADLGQRFDVKGYPTILEFRGSVESKSSYEGPRESAGIVEYVKKNIGPAVTDIATQAAFTEVSTSGLVVVGFYKSGSADEKEFREFAKKNRKDFKFAIVTDKALFQGEEAGSIVFYTGFDEGHVSLRAGAWDAAALTEFLNANKLPLVGEISQANYQSYMSRGIPIAWAFLDTDSAESKGQIDVLKKIAVDVKGKISVVYLSGKQYGQMASRMGLPADVQPSFAIEDAEQAHYVYPLDGPWEVAKMQAWLKSYVSGELTPTVKSEPIPAEPKDEGVYVVVADNFKQIVLDDTKDVLIEFYAPWCGHCKTLAPKLVELAKSLESSPNVVIAKMDATANDVPAKGFKVEGFPTLYFKPAGGKAIPFDGDRSKEGMAKFIKTHGSTSHASKIIVDDSDDEL